MTALRGWIALLLTLLTTATQAADCTGRNLLDQIPAEARAKIESDAARAPFAKGNLWRATRGDAVVHLVGTYHLDDPRHAATLARLAPLLAKAQTLLVEAGPLEEQALQKRITEDPSIIVNTTGPTLPEVMQDADWKRLSQAVAARGIPSIMAAKFKPWYLSMLLGIPPCAFDLQTTPMGLDALLIKSATDQDLQIQSLEPYDTVLHIFNTMDQKDQIDMILSSLAVESKADDLAVTLADTYFAENARLIWELSRYETMQIPGYTPERADAELAVMENAMMTTRNRAWIPVIEAAAIHGPVLAAFGALHLSGDSGVLALLQADGFTIERIPLH